MPVTRKTYEFTAIHQSLSGSAKMVVGVTTMPAPTMLRRKSVKEAVQRFVERVSQLPQVKAVLLAWGDGGWEVWTVIDEWDDEVVDAVIEQEGVLLDELSAQQGKVNLGFHIVVRKGRPLEEFLSPLTQVLFRRE